MLLQKEGKDYIVDNITQSKKNMNEKTEFGFSEPGGWLVGVSSSKGENINSLFNTEKWDPPARNNVQPLQAPGASVEGACVCQ